MLVFWSAFVAFSNLDRLPLRLWDEARNAHQALAIAETGQFMVLQYNGQPDHWQTKPPLLPLLMAGCIKVFGPQELAIRLPSAIFSFLTLWLIFFFIKAHFKSARKALLSALAFSCIPGVVGEHIARFGDFDAALTFFSLCYAICLFQYLERKKIIFLIGFALAFTGAIFTKGIAGAFVLFGMSGFLLLSGKLTAVLLDFKIWLAGLVAVFLLCWFYVARSELDPGFLAIIYENEIGGRFSKGFDGHGEAWYYYINALFNKQASMWMIPFIGAVWLGFQNKAKERNWLLLCISVVVLVFLLLSASQTKIDWYLAPIFPFIAMASGLFLDELATFFEQQLSHFSNQKVWLGIAIILVSGPFISGFLQVFEKVYLPTDSALYERTTYSCTALLRKIYQNQEPFNHFVVVENGLNTQHEFYYCLILQKQGKDIRIKGFSDLTPSDTVLASNPEILNSLHEKFNVQILQKWGLVSLVSLNPK